MKHSIDHCTHRFTTRLPDSLFQHIKSHDKPSDYVRELIERDMSVVQNGKS